MELLGRIWADESCRRGLVAASTSGNSVRFCGIVGSFSWVSFPDRPLLRNLVGLESELLSSLGDSSLMCRGWLWHGIGLAFVGWDIPPCSNWGRRSSVCFSFSRESFVGSVGSLSMCGYRFCSGSCAIGGSSYCCIRGFRRNRSISLGPSFRLRFVMLPLLCLLRLKSDRPRPWPELRR